jgi:hypothetical protein
MRTEVEAGAAPPPERGRKTTEEVLRFEDRDLLPVLGEPHARREAADPTTEDDDMGHAVLIVAGDPTPCSRPRARLLLVAECAAKEQLAASFQPHERDPKMLGGARGPDPVHVAAQLVNAQRGMPLVLIEIAHRIEEALLVSGGGPDQGLDEVER